MRVLICGDRNWTDRELIEDYIKTLPPGSVVIQGMASGADEIARITARVYGYKVEDYPAKWGLYGRVAGPIRNKEMLMKGNPELVVAFHDNLEHSKGTKDMIRQAKIAGVPVEVRTSFQRTNENE